ncbi:hydroxymethylglutaryl-CoA reductase, degradative [Christiangramia forsetii]|uniref:3-hydroxy-3-methylglutaryl coenzyme A reductase n=2 Tax=Christiangramia forsetii TaxID=411153 RepID=A0M5M5_CHRFK|nr:hydroxymethylglutaryl-CoA reductase, degradative [Christiangramia forsetii]GGG32579.1 3-hydroxy-3-methylglutaryl coenzyme A reductase [Christiangramia forsetii]CAL67920.1 degradative hydroxymethylglutaryl-CoA reductase [Christiangramia forsetii KT0803]
MTKPVNGFSKFSKSEKIAWLAENYLAENKKAVSTLQQYWNDDEKLQKLHDEFIENTVSNFYLPLGLAPNFLINGKHHVLPMAIEESSVVAAASKAAKFWSERGGFKATVINQKKIGQVHFLYTGDFSKLEKLFKNIEPKFRESVKSITRNMEKRGGGILEIDLIDKTQDLKNYYQLFVKFDTRDSMGANFINSCLEKFAEVLQEEASKVQDFTKEENLQIIMSILSNYVPECIVRAEVSCPVNELSEDKNMSGEQFAEKFVQAVKIAEIEPYRAVTHNKGIMNGIDAVVLATGNDFRAVEAGIHAYASRNGSYSSLTHASVENGIFKFWMEIPLALGTVGGLTSLHPLVKLALDILQKPSASELMEITAVAGLAQNFAALRSLTTTGIQQGHMKMHLMNILNQNEATENEKEKMVEYFTHHTITHSSVIDQLEKIRS